MIKFDILNIFTGAVQFTAEIDCAESAERSVKLGLAVRWAVKTGANLDGANLDGANLYRASLDGANLDGASLNRANLDRANLDGASLNWANLDGASLNWVRLNGASLDGANLNRANGVNDYVKCIQIDQYPIAYTSDVMQIGCQRHKISEWREFDDHRIAKMDGKDALRFWRKYKDWVFQTIDMCPAKPTQEAKKEAE